jgi:hypothetical protein
LLKGLELVEPAEAGEGDVAVGGEAVGAALGAWAMHKVAKRPKIVKTWNP